MRSVRLLIVSILLAGLVSGCGRHEEKKSKAPAYEGKQGTKIGEARVNPKDGAEMVWVPAGEFVMGSTDAQIAAVVKEYKNPAKELKELLKDLFTSEKPQRKVYLDGYWIYKNEVTVGQYRKFCKANGREMPEPPNWKWIDSHPMVYIDWDDALAYAKWAGVLLPTEAQWEKAARGTDGRIYPWGNAWDPTKCANNMGKELEHTEPVGSYPAGVSPYGAMDMAGNASEWCLDWYSPTYYKTAPSKNPKGPHRAVRFTAAGVGTVVEARVVRGGSWLSGYGLFRCTYRAYNGPKLLYGGNGFRCVKNP